MEYVTLGKIVGFLGLKGDIKVYSSTDFGNSRYKKGNKVFLFNESTKERIKVTVNTYRNDGNLDIINLKEYTSLNEIEKTLHFLVQVEKSAKDLPKGSYFHSDLIGCKVLDSQNHEVGIVKKIEEYSSYKTLRISREQNKDVLVPFIPNFITSVDIEKKIISIKEIEGLL